MTHDTPFLPGSLLAAYLRMSTGANQDLSTLQQESYISTWCAEHGYILARIFKDEFRSGTTTAGRDGFESMMRWLRTDGKVGERKVAGVVVWRMSRIARDLTDAQFYKADIRRRGYKVISLQDNIPDGDVGQIVESIIDWTSQLYINDLKEDIKRGQHYLAMVPKTWPLGSIPLGFTRKGVKVGERKNGAEHIGWKLVPDETTAPLVRLAFRLRADGATYDEIDRQTHLFRARSGYYKMFRNEIYAGTFRMSDIVVPDFCEPLIERRIWETVQAINKGWSERRGYYQPRAITSTFILTGLLKCAHCGRSMVARTGEAAYGARNYYVCKGRMEGKCDAQGLPKDEIESWVLQDLAELAQDPGALLDVYQKMTEQSRGLTEERAAQIGGLQARLDETNAGIGRLVAAITAVGHSQALLEQLKEMELAKVEVGRELASLQVREISSGPVITLEDAMIRGNELADKLLSDSFRDRQLAIRGFVDEIRAKKMGGRKGTIEGEIVLLLPLPDEDT